MLGLPLLYSLLQMTIGLVTASSTAIRDTTAEPIRLLKFCSVLVYLARVASLAMTVGWLYREVSLHSSKHICLLLDHLSQLHILGKIISPLLTTADKIIFLRLTNLR